MQNITEYKYNDKYLLQETLTTNSSGKKNKEEVKYPFEMGSVESNVYVTMTNNNMLNYPVIKSSYIDNILLNKVRTSYKLWTGSIFKPSIVYITNGTSAEEPRLQYHNYDAYGNPQYITKDGINDVVYLWSYYGRYPIAEIINATYTQVRDALGGETAVKDLAAKPEPTSADWTKVDGLRNSLANSLISTYNYLGLSGINKITDSRSVKTSYDLDRWGRLVAVKNHENSVVLRNEYNYTTKPINLTVDASSSYDAGSTKNFIAYTNGGFGNFSYDWTLTTLTGTTLKSATNTNNQFFVDFNTLSMRLGDMKLTCTVNDNVSGKSVTQTYNFKVVVPAIQFRNVSTRQISSTEAELTAEIYSYNPSGVAFLYKVDGNPLYTYTYSVYCNIGTTYFNSQIVNSSETKSINLSAGINYVKMTIRRQTKNSYSVKGSLKMLGSNDPIGSNNYIELSF